MTRPENPGQIMLLALQRARHGLSYERLIEDTALPVRTVSRICTIFVQRELIERTRRGFYRLTDLGRNSLRIGSARQGRGRPFAPRNGARGFPARLWAALRNSGKASTGDLLLLACDGTERSPEPAARRYLRALERAGFVAAVGPARGDAQRWLLMRNTGPKAPTYSPVRRTVYDANTRELHELSPVSEVSHATA